MDLQLFACKPSRLSNTKTFCTLHWVKACCTGPPLIFRSTARALGSRNWKKPFVLYTGESLLHWASINFWAYARGSHSRGYNCETREGTLELAFAYTNNCPQHSDNFDTPLDILSDDIQKISLPSSVFSFLLVFPKMSVSYISDCQIKKKLENLPGSTLGSQR